MNRKTLIEIIDTTNEPDIFATAMTKPEIHLHGYQTAKDYAKGKGWQTDKYVYQLVRDKKVDSFRVKELNNLLLVRDKK